MTPMSPQRIIAMASAYYDSCVLFAASDLGIFSHLSKGPADADAIGKALGLAPRGALLLLDACVAVELLSKDGNSYCNTPEAQAFLVAGSPGDLSKAIRYNRDVLGAWGKLTELAKSGAPVESPAIHLGDDEDRTRTFVQSMHGRALALGPAVIPHLDLAGRSRLLDIGGGPGTFSVLAAKANPELSCTVLDLPEVVRIADALIAAQGMAERVSTCPGDYHSTPFPKNMDAVNILGVLHQESPESILDILKSAYAAMVPGGILHIMDMMTDATHTAPKFSALFAVNMALTTTNGWVFSDTQLKEWMEAAGFENVTIKPLPPPLPHWLAVAVKPVD